MTNKQFINKVVKALIETSWGGFSRMHQDNPPERVSLIKKGGKKPPVKPAVETNPPQGNPSKKVSLIKRGGNKPTDPPQDNPSEYGLTGHRTHLESSDHFNMTKDLIVERIKANRDKVRAWKAGQVEKEAREKSQERRQNRTGKQEVPVPPSNKNRLRNLSHATLNAAGEFRREGDIPKAKEALSMSKPLTKGIRPLKKI